MRNTPAGEGSSDATDGSRSYVVEDRQARRGSRASSVESEETDDATTVHDSTDNSLLEPFQNLQFMQFKAGESLSGRCGSGGAGSVRRWCTN